MRTILTVTDAADSQRLATVDQLRAELAEASADYEDERLEELLDQASSAIALYCNRIFARETLSQVFRFEDEMPEFLLLGRRQVAEIASVTEDAVELVAGDYEVEPKEGLLYRLDGDDDRSAWCARKVTVVYTAGWLLPEEGGTDLPEAVTRACVLLAASYANGQGRDPFVKAETLDGVGGQTLYVPGAGQPWLPPEVAMLLDLGGFVVSSVGG